MSGDEGCSAVRTKRQVLPDKEQQRCQAQVGVADHGAIWVPSCLFTCHVDDVSPHLMQGCSFGMPAGAAELAAYRSERPAAAHQNGVSPAE